MTTYMKPDALLWIDTETTGTDLHQLDYHKLDLTTLRLQRRFTGRPDPYADHHATSHRTTDCIRRDIHEYRHTIQKEANQ